MNNKILARASKILGESRLNGMGGEDKKRGSAWMFWSRGPEFPVTPPRTLLRGYGGGRTAWVVSVVPWLRTPWVVGQLWGAPTASVDGE